MNCASFTKTSQQMQTLSCAQEMQIFNLKWLLFPYCLPDFFLKINTVEAIDKMNKLCKFHESPTKNIDFIV